MEMISLRGGTTIATALAGSRDRPQHFMDNRVTQHTQYRPVFYNFLSLLSFFFPMSDQG